MDEEQTVERRTFLGGLTAASFGAFLASAFAAPARAQTSSRCRERMAGQPSFEPTLVTVAGNTIFVRRYGRGPAVLLVHGFPRTSLMWRLLAPKLAENHTVVITAPE